MKRLWVAALMMAMAVAGLGQGATVLFPPAVNQNGGGLPFATITFCSTPTTIGSTGVCQTPITVFKDQGLTQAYGAIQTDGIGFFPPNAVTATSLWFTPGNNYCFTVTTTNMQSPSTNPCTPFSVSVAPGTSPSFASVTLSSFLKSTETSAPTCLAGFDFIWGDSTAHRMKECDNGGSAVQLVHSGVDVNASDQVTTIHLGGGAAVSAYQGNGTKVQLSTGTTTTNDFVSYDANGNAVDAGKALPSGAVVGTTDAQVITTKTIDTASNTFKVNGTTVNEATGILTWGCTGTFGSSQTDVIFWGVACSNGTGNQIPVMAGTFQNLRCHANTGGSTAGSGAVTVRKNGVNTSTTCTIGTGTSCSDTTHSFTTASGDLIDVTVVTGAAETLATMACSLEKF